MPVGWTATVAEEAHKWWLAKRPLSFTRDEHLANPTINCVGAYERALAGAVAQYDQSTNPNESDEQS